MLLSYNYETAVNEVTNEEIAVAVTLHMVEGLLPHLNTHLLHMWRLCYLTTIRRYPSMEEKH